jgi:gamma-glutamylcyclotransferase (GGCT)/AIG2-like uncharacterized protein YtfP
MSGSELDVVAVYGTLRRGERNHGLLAGAEYLGHGFVDGVLHVVPSATLRPYPYPALLVGGGRVRVELFRLPDGQMLDELDELEGYDHADEGRSEYVRRVVPVIEGPVGRAWAYLYAGDPAELAEPVEGGDWSMHAPG